MVRRYAKKKRTPAKKVKAKRGSGIKPELKDYDYYNGNPKSEDYCNNCVFLKHNEEKIWCEQGYLKDGLSLAPRGKKGLGFARPVECKKFQLKEEKMAKPKEEKKVEPKETVSGIVVDKVDKVNVGEPAKGTNTIPDYALIKEK